MLRSMFARRHHPAPFDSAASTAAGWGSATQPRLNLLLSYGGWRDDALERQLPPLLRPMGVHCLEARSGSEAETLLRRERIHVAVVDVSVPMGDGVLGSDAVGSRILQILRRLDQPPPTVVVRPPQPSQRDATRGLHAMLAEGAFAVLDRPFPVESLLETLRRILQRHYAGTWPTGHAS
jgi:DNA-binding response OmpR family regulator